jgi:DNA primase
MSAPQYAVREWLEHSVPSRSSGDGDEFVLEECPWCAKARHCYANPGQGTFYCFKCHESGPIIRLVAEVEQCTDAEATRILARIIFARPLGDTGALRARAVAVAEVKAEEITPRVIDLPEGFTPCWDGERVRVPRYLLDRGVTREQARAHGMGWCDDGPYRGRVIVPVTCAGDRSWIARDATGEARRKFLYPTGAPQGRILGLYDLVQPEPEVVVLVEGVFDALRLERSGVPSLALLGKTLGRLQRARLLRLRARRTVVMLDPDAPEDAVRVASEIGPGAVVAQTTADPDELDDAAVHEAIDTARPPARAGLSRLRDRVARLVPRHEDIV